MPPILHAVAAFKRSFLLIAGVLCLAPFSKSQVVSDGSLGSANVRFSSGRYSIPAAAGFLKGHTLFHSFQSFNLSSTESAVFRDLNGVRNVLARVTGGPSLIDGKISCSSNLFLVNPQGVLFGPNASLNVNGSFATTTADYLRLNDGAFFSARAFLGEKDNLSTAPVSAFGFLTPTPGPVVFSGSRLQTQKALTVVAGNVFLDNSRLRTRSGRLALASTDRSGELPVSMSGSNPGGKIRFQNDSSARTEGGGRLVIRGGKLTMVGGSMLSSGSRGPAPGGDIDAQCQSLSLTGGSQISATTSGQSAGGNVRVIASGALALGGTSGGAKIRADVLPGAAGHGGDVFLRSHSLSLLDGGEISASTYGQASAGSVRISVQSQLLLDGAGSDAVTGIFSSVESSAIGDGGNVRIRADKLAVLGGGTISTDVSGIGNAGTLDVNARQIVINALNPDYNSYISSDVLEEAQGNGGLVKIRAGDLRLVNGGLISADTLGLGDGGDIDVSVSKLFIDGRGVSLASGISARGGPSAIGAGGNVRVSARSLLLVNEGGISASHFGQGHGGNIQVRSHSLSILNGAAISSEASGHGNGGSIDVFASRKLTIDGAGSRFQTGIFAGVLVRAVGDGGDLLARSPSIEITNSGFISASTYGPGDGGEVRVLASKSLNVHHNGVISANVERPGQGKGGAVIVRSPMIALSTGGKLSSVLFGRGGGGRIAVQAAQSLTIDGKNSNEVTGIFATVERNGRGSGGDIDIHGKSLILVNSGSIAATVSPGAEGEGGNIVIHGESLSLTHGAAITASTFALGNSGNIEISVAKALTLGRSGSNQVTAIVAGVGETAFGDGGNLSLRCQTLAIVGPSTINANSLGHGDGGDIEILARESISIDPAGYGLSYPSGITAGVASTAVGDGGDILLTSPTISLVSGALINASNFGQGIAGNVDITASRLLSIDGTNAPLATGIGAVSGTKFPAGSISLHVKTAELKGQAIISSANRANGAAGSIDLVASDSFTLTGGSLISVSSETADAGTITVAAAGRLNIAGGSSISASAGAGGGNISLLSPERIFLDHSNVQATAGTATQGSEGGIISFGLPRFFILDHSGISANAAAGRGGNISIGATSFLSSSSSITATGTTAGSVQIAAPLVDFSGALAGLPEAFIDTSSRFQERCAMRLGTDSSTFLLVGRGGTPFSPDELSSF